MSKTSMETIEFSHMSDQEIGVFLKENKISLTIDEAREIEQLLGRGPTLTEAIMIGIQCSEHCSYRSSKEHLKRLPTQAPNIIIGVGEDSGIVEICRDKNGKRYGAILAHESHNHPSQVVPYEGAATGVGGIMRDIVCMGGRAIASLDPLRFGNPNNKNCQQIANEVVTGISGYGNPLGVANLGGDVYFHNSFNDNCLVNVVGVGMLHEDEIIHSFAPENADGYDIIVVGKPTDNSGMGGAAFASIDLNEQDKEANKGAVQEPNPFLEQHILEATYELFTILKEKNMLHRVGFKDMGAGGVMCSSIELAEGGGYGADIEVKNIHTALENLHPSVIACSETQERFCWVCPPELTPTILDHYNIRWELPKVSHKAQASLVGTLNTSGNYRLTFEGNVICNAPTHILTKGLQYTRKASPQKKDIQKKPLPENVNLNELVLTVLSHKDVCSRRDIYNRYDKHVQGMTVLEAGVADAGVMKPLIHRSEASDDIRNTGIALSVDANPRYTSIDPKIGTIHAVLESVRNVATVGATPQCLTDCLNFGNPEKPESFWQFTESIDGLIEATHELKLKDFPDTPIPFISGNVSFYNESQTSAVAPSPVIACLGTLKNADTAITMELKGVGNNIFLIGARQNNLGGSVLADIYETQTFTSSLLNDIELLPHPELQTARKEIYAIVDMITQGLIVASHDISDGGLITTCVEMMLGGWGEGKHGLAMNLDTLDTSLSVLSLLFGEAGGIVVEVKDASLAQFKSFCDQASITPYYIGKTTNTPELSVSYQSQNIIKLESSQLLSAWAESLRSLLS